MKRWMNWLLSPLVLGTIGLLLLSALIWWVGPLLAIGNWRPLDGVWARVVLIALLWLAWIARQAWRAWRQRRANDALLAGISSGSSAIDRESEVLNQRFREAIDKLRSAGKGKRSGAGTLYELPWYVFVGAPGSGKTTALQNAGLQFLLTEGATGGPVKGVGGTRNCDWWFTSEAVLIDTAGRYTTQESDSSVDAKAWDNFLSLLRKSRPRRPINGVLLTINIQDLLQQNPVERKEHAQKLRARLHDLQTKLGVKAPVYVLITKTDLVAGFNETFDAFNKDQRDQVWGFTFDPKATGAMSLASFDSEFTTLEQQLNSGLFERLQAERDTTKRASMFGFPVEFASLRPVLGEFLGLVFSSGGALQDDVRLRGVYFTSGTQEGTPIDRVMGALSRSFGLQARATAVPGQKGKSFFLRRLLQDLIFRERDLVSFNPALERRRRILRGTGFAVVALASIALLAGWGVSFTRNQAYVQHVAAKLPELHQAVDALPPAQSGDVTPLPAVLTAVRNAAEPADFAVANPPLLNTLGLYQGNKLDAAAQIAYRRLLENALLPRVARRLEERLRASNKNNLEQAYEALKSYLMLYTPDKFDAEALKAWIAVDWDANYARSMTPEQRQALDAHLDALLALGAPDAVAPMDKTLVDNTRDMLTAYPLEYRIYSRLKRQYKGDLPEFSVARVGGPNAAQVFERASGEPLSKGISGFYTKDGYQKTFQGSVQGAAIKLAAEESWVLGVRNGPGLKDLAGTELSDRVRRLYLEDYVKVWDSYLADVRLVKLAGVARSMEAARVLAAVDSPLASYLRAVARETTLIPPAGQASQGALGKLVDQATKNKEEMAKLAGAQPAPAAGNGPIEHIVDDHFAAMNRLVQGTPPPIDDVLKLFGEVYAQLQAVDAAQKSKSPPPPPAAAEHVKAAAGTQPEPIRSMLATLADAGAKGSREGERDVMTGELKPVFDFCNRAITNRYPFASGSKADVLPDDFGQLFGPGGMLDDFFQRRLATLVDTGTNPWRYKPLADGARPASPAALADFQRAARIKEGFFRSGGKTPGFRLEIRAVEMSEGLKELDLDIDGQVLKFTAGNNTSVIVNWPSQKVGSQIKLTAVPAITPLTFEGPWALFRLFDRFDVQPSAQPEKFNVIVNVEGKRARLEVIANSVMNPFRMREIQQFRCPGAL
ncbi:MAG: type VI secretion system membrane subunit TssM [Burkholderiaceae bacterium]